MFALTMKTNIKPKRIIYKNNVHKILTCDDMFTITKYKIYLNSNKVYKVTINAKHPNYDHTNNQFCLPSYIKDQSISKELINIIENTLATFNLDNCYYNVWKYFKYEERSQT